MQPLPPLMELAIFPQKNMWRERKKKEKEGRRKEGKEKRKGNHLNHFIIHLKLTQYFKSTVLQYIKKISYLGRPILSWKKIEEYFNEIKVYLYI